MTAAAPLCAGSPSPTGDIRAIRGYVYIHTTQCASDTANAPLHLLWRRGRERNSRMGAGCGITAGVTANSSAETEGANVNRNTPEKHFPRNTAALYLMVKGQLKMAGYSFVNAPVRGGKEMAEILHQRRTQTAPETRHQSVCKWQWEN